MGPILRALLLCLLQGSLKQASCQKVETLRYRTATVTECISGGDSPVNGQARASGASPGPLRPSEDPVTVVISMPDCPRCTCSSCVHTSVYTTTFDVFCSTGVTYQAYVVSELYTGMTAFPTLDTTPGVPLGFTTAVETCTVCGIKPLVATMTFPATRPPYLQGLGSSTPTPIAAFTTSYKPCSSRAGDTGTGPGCGSQSTSARSGSDTVHSQATPLALHEAKRASFALAVLGLAVCLAL